MMTKQEPIRLDARLDHNIRDADEHWSWVIDDVSVPATVVSDTDYDNYDDAIDAARDWVKSLADREIIVDD
jgi:hypothetical protein